MPSISNYFEESGAQVVQLTPPKSINQFSDLSSLFLAHFTTMKFKPKSVFSLLGLHQRHGESFRDFLEQYNAEKLLVEELQTQAVILMLLNWL